MNKAIVFLLFFTAVASAFYTSKDDVVELTDGNFDKLVTKGSDAWMVEFYAPWCGHCRSLTPAWKKAATQLKGKVKVGAVDATKHEQLARRHNVNGYPTIKFFSPDGEKTRLPISSLHRLSSKGPTQKKVEEACKDTKLCVFAFLPHILDCNAKCRKKYVTMLQKLANKFRKQHWGWVWFEGGVQTAVERAFNVQGLGYPMLSAVNVRKGKYATMRGSFSEDDIGSFLLGLSVGNVKVGIQSLPDEKMPEVIDAKPWDGKDQKVEF
ncbi:unnamed protein product [Caenorhabditis auriculariae]|uniref:protein disulfide-isomerase n=1 Tax=Caenorhabditis auriculariae TaxID=2777116 RepID=A0A8S1H4A3_9PELO|nr:unnamed protein product [Caenorhabditis auriculariae]